MSLLVSQISGGTFEDEGHTYRNETGNRVLSVTQVLESVGLVNYDGIRQHILERKSQIGSAFHKSIEYLVQGCLNWDTVSDEVMPYVLGTECWLKDSGFIVEEQEQRGIHLVNGMQFGFTFDMRGKVFYKGQERRAILDLKSCYSYSPAWQIQLAGYELASPPVDGGYLRIALQAKKDGTAKPYFFEDSTDRNVFLYALAVSIWKQNHGL